jgi:hypothetical protein
MGDIEKAVDRVDFAEEENGNFDRSWREEKFGGEKPLDAEAQDSYIDEKELGTMAAIKAYPMAVVWSLVLSTCVIMEGYDTNLLGNFFAYRECFHPCSNDVSTMVSIKPSNGFIGQD